MHTRTDEGVCVLRHVWMCVNFRTATRLQDLNRINETTFLKDLATNKTFPYKLHAGEQNGCNTADSDI